MGAVIHVPAEKTWDFFQKNKARLQNEQATIAENEETEYAVTITEDTGLPLFTVFKGDRAVDHEGAVDAEDCRDTAQRLFVKHLFPVTVIDNNAIPHGEQMHISDLMDKEDELPELPPTYREDLDDVEWMEVWEACHEIIDESEEDLEDHDPAYDVMYIRQDEVDIAAKEFLSVLFEDSSDISNELLNDFIHHTMMYFAAVHTLPVWYPMVYSDEATGSSIFSTYPYIDMCETFSECEFR